MSRFNQLQDEIASIAQKVKWRSVPRAELIAEIDLRNWGGAELFVADVNGDGRPELLWLQSKGIFKSQLYQDCHRFGNRYAFLATEDLDLLCLTVTDINGAVLWQYGTPNFDSNPYCSHAAEGMVCCHDIDGDGEMEVLVLGRRDLLVLEGRSGRLKASQKLPADNYALLTCIENSPLPGDVTTLVTVMDAAYEPHSYGNPTLFLNSRLDILRQDDHIGSGHSITVFDADGDGCQEALVGYQLIKPNGEIIWTLKRWEDHCIEAETQHVDHVELYRHEGTWFLVIAGSDRLYWVDCQGKTGWEQDQPHPQYQYCLVGRFCLDDFRPRLFVTNCRELTNCFDVEGNEVWRRRLPEHWPMGRPSNLGRRSFHKGVPAVVWHSPLPERPDLIIYSEAGWPYGIGGDNQPALVFPYTANARKPSMPLPDHRADDYGMSFNCVVYDFDQDGTEEVLIHDRRYAWLYRIN